jgi:hypothetical protein
MTKKILAITVALFLLGGCATSTRLNVQSTGEGPDWLIDTNLSTDISDDPHVLNGSSSKVVYFIKKKSGQWTLASAQDNGSELIVVDYDQLQIRLAAKGVKVVGNGVYKRFKCGTVYYFPRGNDECKSDFAVLSIEGDDVLTTILIWPAKLVFGFWPVDKIVDTESLNGAIVESGLLDAINMEYESRWMRKYDEKFNEISSASEAYDFIYMYYLKDPKGRVPLAKSAKEAYQALDQERKNALVAIRAKEHAERLALEKKENAEIKALQIRRAKDEALRTANAIRNVSKFRATVVVGSETNCGPVIETRGKLIKVFSPVMNYGNEHWIPISKLFPASHGCQFNNGRYVEPSY